MRNPSMICSAPESGAELFRALLPVEFSTLDLVIDDIVQANTRLSPGSESEVMRLAVSQRVLTIVQGSRLLLEEGHWELASAAVRQLFELLVNIEHLLDESDPETAWESYRRYGEAQALQASLRKLNYAVSAGFKDSHGEVANLSKALADARFDEFRHPKGHIRDSWTGRTVEKLAHDSRVPWRAEQYRYYFRTWSEQAHATPSSFVSNFSARAQTTGLDHELAMFAREAEQLITMLISISADLTSALGIFASAQAKTARRWQNHLRGEDTQ